MTYQIAKLEFDEGWLKIELASGEHITEPIDRYPRLKKATSHERSVWEMCASGCGIHWPLVDEDLSIPILLGANES